MKESLTKLFGFGDRHPGEEIKMVRTEDIVPGPCQPRTLFDDDRLDELCQSIRTHGVIQPIVVRVRNNKYEIVAGERRYRAVKKLNLPTIPVIVRELNDAQAASVALIENLQREGLTAIEEAAAYQRLMELHDLTQESLAQRLGKSQSTIANKIRLLQLSEPVKQAMLERKITERHARALLALNNPDDQLKVLGEIIAKDLTVKQTEARIASMLNKPAPAEGKKRRISFPRDIRLAVNTIRQSVDMVASSGVRIETDERLLDDCYEFVIRIPKQ